MENETEEKTVVTPQEMTPEQEDGFFLRAFKKLVAWVMLLIIITLVIGFLFFTGLAIYRGIIWLWPW